MDVGELSRLTVGALLEQQAARFGDREYAVFPGRGVRFTYRQFLERVNQVARGLIALGVRKSEHVAVWAGNVPEWLLLQFAAAKAGAIVIPIEPAADAQTLESILRHSDATTLFFGSGADDSRFAAQLRSVLPDVDSAPVGHAHFEHLPRLSRLLFIGTVRLPGMLRFDDLGDLAANTHSEDLRRRSEAHASFDVAALRYDAAANGALHGAMLTHRNIILNAWHVTERMRLNEGDAVCIPIDFAEPFAWIAGNVGCALRGARLVAPDNDQPATVLETIASERCTALYGTPMMFESYVGDPHRATMDHSSLRTGAVIGAPEAHLIEEIAARLGANDITVAFGVPAAAAAISQTSPADPLEKRLHTAGSALPMMQLKIIDPQTGDTLVPGSEGLLCCRGHALMKGFAKDPQATAAAIDAEGWLHTGVTGAIDAQGYLSVARTQPIAGTRTHLAL
jgi:fatty-acyl-CoA synthase